ncbi:MAG: hypothetical protein DRI57_30745 [Deltaproteobacteria bacterium]|nr:MAG: hypothetical protein DRI57_30745 [Deltaproteobacteria bacterium]
MSFADGSGITAETDGSGNGGIINIRASDSVELSGVNPHGENRFGFGTGLYVRSTGENENAGKGGDIVVESGSLSVTDGAVITGTTLGRGQGGRIALKVKESVSISGDSSGTGQETPLMSQNEFRESHPQTGEHSASGIYSRSESTAPSAGKAGEINLTARNLTLPGKGKITAEAKSAGGGKINVRAGNEIYILGGNITTSVRQGEGNGGDITADSEFVILNRSEITANAEEGDGGAIFIHTDNYIKSADSKITATSKRGNDGTVRIESPDTDISSDLVILPGTLLDASRWMKTPCACRSAEKAGRFVIKGQDAMPTAFDDWQPSPLLWSEDKDDKKRRIK